MGIEFIYPEFEVVRDQNRCIKCKVCVRQCANEVHTFDDEGNVILSDDAKCVEIGRAHV